MSGRSATICTNTAIYNNAFIILSPDYLLFYYKIHACATSCRMTIPSLRLAICPPPYYQIRLLQPATAAYCFLNEKKRFLRVPKEKVLKRYESNKLFFLTLRRPTTKVDAKRGKKRVPRYQLDARVEQKPGGWDTHNVKGVYSALCSLTILNFAPSNQVESKATVDVLCGNMICIALCVPLYLLLRYA